jgi:DNA invertase Pin-like site-specific DNA recombinase
MATQKAYSYLRFSTPDQMAGDSFRRQTALAVEYAKRKNLELDQTLTFQDLGVSAFRGKNAEVGRLADFLDAVKVGLVPQGSFLLVESLDRISRQAARKALRVLESLCDEGIVVVTLTDGREYSKEALDSDPFSLIISLITFIRANEESVMKSKRGKAAWVGKRLQADTKPLTKKCPAWLAQTEDGKWKAIPERAKVVRRIFADTLRGLGQHRIAQALNEEGVPVFRDGQMWHRSYVCKILQNPSVIGHYTPGLLEWKDGKKTRSFLPPIPGYYPAVVSEEDFRRVQAMRLGGSRSPSRGMHATKPPRNIFGGLCVCARCGGSMVLVNKGPRGGQVRLVCYKAKIGAGCKYTLVPYQQLQEAFQRDAEALLSLTPSGSSGEALDAAYDRLEASLGVAKDRHKQFETGYGRSGSQGLLLKTLEAEAEVKELEARLQELQDKRDATRGPLVEKRTGELKGLLKADPLDTTKVNALMRTVFSGVSIDPDTGVASFGWSHGGETEVIWGMPRKYQSKRSA